MCALVGGPTHDNTVHFLFPHKKQQSKCRVFWYKKVNYLNISQFFFFPVLPKLKASLQQNCFICNCKCQWTHSSKKINQMTLTLLYISKPISKHYIKNKDREWQQQYFSLWDNLKQNITQTQLRLNMIQTHKALKLGLKYHDYLTNKKPTYRKNADTHGMANISDNTLIFITKKPSKSLTNLSIVSCWKQIQVFLLVLQKEIFHV